MGKRAGLWLSLFLAVSACLSFAACTGTPPLFHAVTLNPQGPITVASNSTQAITASVLNDSTGAGVTWATPANGSLSAVTTTSVTYNAPAVAAGASVVDTVTATSVSFSNQSASLMITVEGAPVVSTTSLPAGNQGSPYSATVSATGGVGPFTWSLAGGALPAGLSLGASSTNSMMITGTPTTQETSNFTIKVTDSSGAFGTQALSIMIGAPLPLMVSTTSLPDGVLNTAYSATTLQASGGVPPFTWVVTSAPGTFPTGLALAADGQITGTPTVVGTFNFSVQVTDSETPAQTAVANLSITVDDLGPLSGNYVFEFSGFNASGPVVIAGSFTADGVGNITNGIEDVNSTFAAPANQTFTGTYTLGSGNRGVLTLSSLQGSPAFSFAIDSTGSHGRLIEFDSSGTQGSGQIEKRSVNTCASDTLNGQYAFGISGHVVASQLSLAGPAVMVGSFGANPPVGAGAGSIATGEDDASTPSGVTTRDLGLSGTFQTTAQSTRCTMTLFASAAPAGLVFSVYPVSSVEAFMVETNAVSSSGNNIQPFLLAGKMLLQFGYPFVGVGGSQFESNAISIGGLTGQFFNGASYEPDLALVALTGTGGPTYSLSILENTAGIVLSASSPGLTFTQSDQFGRLETDITPINPVFYTINNNEAFCIGEIPNDPFFGILEPQSGSPFTASELNGDFVLGTAAPSISSVPNLSGDVTLANTFTTAGTINGTEEESTTSANTAGQTVTGTYSNLNSATGAGTAALTSPATFSGEIMAISPTKIVILSTTPGDGNPVLIYLGDCTLTCGED